MEETNQPAQPEAVTASPVLSKKMNNQVLIIAMIIAFVALLSIIIITLVIAGKNSTPANNIVNSNNTNSVQPLTLNNMPTIVSSPVVSSPEQNFNLISTKTFTFGFEKPYDLNENLSFSLDAPEDSKVEVTKNAAGWPIANITEGAKELQIVFPYESFPAQYFQDYSLTNSNPYWGPITRVAKQDGTALTQYYTNDLSQTNCQSTDGSLPAPCGSGVMTANDVAISVSCVTQGDGDFSFCDAVAPTIKVTKTDL